MTSTDNAMPLSLFIGLDRLGPIPLWFQIAERIEAAIVAGELPIDSRIENEITLAGRLGISRPTMRRALQELVSRGLVIRRRGIGTQVVSGSVRRRVALTSLHDDLTVAGRVPTTRVLSLDRLPADELVAAALDVPEGHMVVRIERVRSADGQPLAVLANWLPRPSAPFSVAQLEAHGLYELLRAENAIFQSAHQTIGGRDATPREAELLGLPAGSMVLTMTRLVKDPTGRIIEYGSHCYRPSTYSFEMTLFST